MDLSKLPKMSETARAERERNEGAEPLPAQRVGHVVRPATGHADEPLVGAEVWISGVMGLVFVFMGWNFARYVLTTARGGTFHTNVIWQEGTAKAGQEVAYFELQGYTAWTDTAVFLFGVALLADAAMMLIASGSIARRTWLVWAGIGVTGVATAFNVVTVVLLLMIGVRPLISLIAMAVGGYMMAYQWRVVKGPRVG